MKEDEACGLCGMNGEIRNSYKLLVGNSGGKTSFGRCRLRYENNIDMDLREIWCDGGSCALEEWMQARNLLFHSPGLFKKSAFKKGEKYNKYYTKK
jgi:hypothetical protein